MARTPGEPGEPAHVLQARPRRPRIERDRGPEPAAGEREVSEGERECGHEGATQPGLGEDRAEVRSRSSAVVVFIEPDAGCPAGEGEREAAVVGEADRRIHERRERADREHPAAALAAERDDRDPGDAHQGRRVLAWREGDAEIDLDRPYRRRREGGRVHRDRTGDRARADPAPDGHAEIIEEPPLVEPEIRCDHQGPAGSDEVVQRGDVGRLEGVGRAEEEERRHAGVTGCEALPPHGDDGPADRLEVAAEDGRPTRRVVVDRRRTP